MRAPTSFALLVPTASLPTPIRFDGALHTLGTKRLVVIALMAMLAAAGYANRSNAHGQAGSGDAAARTTSAPPATTPDVAPTDGSAVETWAADESRIGTRPDTAH